MKKLLVLLLAGALTLSACKSMERPDAPSPEGDVQASQAAQGAQNAGESEGQVSEGSGLPAVYMETLMADRYTADGEAMLSQVLIDSVTLVGDGYEAAQATVDSLLYKEQAEIETMADELATDAMLQYEEMKDVEYGYFEAYSSNVRYEVARLDGNVLSLSEESYDYLGGVHGYSAQGGVNIDLKTGAELQMSQLSADPAAFMNQLTAVVLEKLEEVEEDLFPEYANSVKEYLEMEPWYLDAAGIEICFNPYEIGPYSSGVIQVCVPYEEVASYMKPEYCGMTGAGVAAVPMNTKVNVSLGSEGVNGTLECQANWTDDYRCKLMITLNGADTVVEEDAYMRNTYLVKKASGKNFLSYCFDYASDDFKTIIFDLTSGKLQQTDAVYGGLNGKCIGADMMPIAHVIQVLGTREALMPYILTEEGELLAQKDVYEFPGYSGRYALEVAQELPVWVDGKETSLQPGTQLYVTATDDAGIAWFTTVDGSTNGEIHYERPEEYYTMYIDGVSEFDYFVELPYAG